MGVSQYVPNGFLAGMNNNFRLNIQFCFHEAKLKQDLLGLPETGAQSVMDAHPGLERVSVVMRPFWSSTFPNDPDKIKVITVIGEKDLE